LGSLKPGKNLVKNFKAMGFPSLNKKWVSLKFKWKTCPELDLKKRGEFYKRACKKHSLDIMLSILRIRKVRI